MTRPALRVDGLGKYYRLGLTHAGSLGEVASRWTRRLRGLPPVAAPVTAAGPDRADGPPPGAAGFWALKEVTFEVRPGEVVGVIGRNGAGKSTLLKVLSRVTAPSAGRIEIEGRVGSLLEVGTGFHPELTGRENVYMNATLLGMSKREVNAKLEEIVEFSGVAQFLDTPVKRYSSGMKVRLGFAVAAHLEPEVLIVDEVLAVGDAEFQKKCLGKMQDVAAEGRTVLFVSHNMAAVRNLCGRCVLLKGGRLAFEGPTGEVVTRYLAHGGRTEGGVLAGPRSGTGAVRLRGFHLEDDGGRRLAAALSGEPVTVCLPYDAPPDAPGPPAKQLDVGFSVHDELDDTLCVLYSSYTGAAFPQAGGGGTFRCRVDRLPLPAGRYRLGARVLGRGVELDWPQGGLGYFDVEPGDFYGTGQVGFPKARFLLDGAWTRSDARPADARPAADRPAADRPALAGAA